MSTKHTPVPWNIYGNEISPVISISEDGTKPALAQVKGRDMHANAEFIVKAVNCHEELLEALKECITDEGSCAMSKHDVNSAIRRLKTINVIARAAIQRAEGDRS